VASGAGDEVTVLAESGATGELEELGVRRAVYIVTAVAVLTSDAGVSEMQGP
jgi:hypothetical protein